MSLAEGKELFEVSESDFVDAAAALSRWEHYPASTISHHGGRCCDVAREWVLATDFSQLNAGDALAGPRWLRQKFAWGPSPWPLHWCEAVRQKTLDCGAHAALAHEIFRARGVRSFPAQFVLQYSEHDAGHWCRRWGADGESPLHWVNEDLIYHEGCAVVPARGGDEIKVWDSSTSWWVNPKQFGGYGGLLALRIFDPQAGPDTAYKWGGHRIAPNVWEKVERARGDFV